jgi:hypothetical protein
LLFCGVVGGRLQFDILQKIELRLKSAERAILWRAPM